MDSKTVPLSQMKVGEHFILQGTEYVRVGAEIEDGGIFCKSAKDGASGLLSQDRPVMRLSEDKTFLAAVVGDKLTVEPALPATETKV